MKATFGAGCFWGVEEAFRTLKGVTKTTVGYMGGTIKNPTYEQVCSDKTGYVEVCQVEFDSKVISYGQLLDKFWKIHDPTQENRQGPDVGTQYRFVIFYHSEEQKQVAEESLGKQQEIIGKKIRTTIEKAKEFYKAEDYHQKYLMKKSLKTC